jgi:hypothetical protein
VDDQENNLMLLVNVFLVVDFVVDCSIAEEQHIVDIVVITSDFLLLVVDN